MESDNWLSNCQKKVQTEHGWNGQKIMAYNLAKTLTTALNVTVQVCTDNIRIEPSKRVQKTLNYGDQYVTARNYWNLTQSDETYRIGVRCSSVRHDWNLPTCAAETFKSTLTYAVPSATTHSSWHLLATVEVEGRLKLCFVDDSYIPALYSTFSSQQRISTQSYLLTTMVSS